MMTAQTTSVKTPPRQLGRSILAVFLGFLAVVVLSLGTDQVMHVLNVYPPWNEPMNEVSDNLLALTYRCVYGVIGSYVTAKFAPHSPMRHVWIGAGIGFVISLLGVFATMNRNLGPIWYPIALVVTALPCAWLGGMLYLRQSAKEK
ncbi:MAG TPA: hypothetical protein PLK30_27925 [Blastocatellia bacterium]|nr:hypothetical protein [Blastocatellia bacterium]